MLNNIGHVPEQSACGAQTRSNPRKSYQTDSDLGKSLAQLSS